MYVRVPHVPKAWCCLCLRGLVRVSRLCSQCPLLTARVEPCSVCRRLCVSWGGRRKFLGATGLGLRMFRGVAPLSSFLPHSNNTPNVCLCRQLMVSTPLAGRPSHKGKQAPAAAPLAVKPVTARGDGQPWPRLGGARTHLEPRARAVEMEQQMFPRQARVRTHDVTP